MCAAQQDALIALVAQKSLIARGVVKCKSYPVRRMLRLLLLVLSSCYTVQSFVRGQGWRIESKSAALLAIQNAPYEDIIPFLSEHVQPSDQLLFVGARTDLCIQLAKNGYGGTFLAFAFLCASHAPRVTRTHFTCLSRCI